MYEDFKKKNYWKSDEKILKISQMINRLYSDTNWKIKRLDSLILSINTLGESISEVEAITNYVPGNQRIIIHCHNEEGKEVGALGMLELASIWEVFPTQPNPTEINLGNSAGTLEDHNLPMPVFFSVGNHTIKAVYNGISLYQDVIIVKDKDVIVTFEFVRTDVTNEIFSNFIQQAIGIYGSQPVTPAIPPIPPVLYSVPQIPYTILNPSLVGTKSAINHTYTFTPWSNAVSMRSEINYLVNGDDLECSGELEAAISEWNNDGYPHGEVISITSGNFFQGTPFISQNLINPIGIQSFSSWYIQGNFNSVPIAQFFIGSGNAPAYNAIAGTKIIPPISSGIYCTKLIKANLYPIEFIGIYPIGTFDESVVEETSLNYLKVRVFKRAYGGFNSIKITSVPYDLLGTSF